ncbi:very short patch repair endonuclease [Spirochaetia bacterium]|nr:very short patch repair endonuclease [Spirochaetia bacterium]
MDNKTKEQRSMNMAAVKSKNTKPELIVRKELFRQGFRYRLNVKKLPGTPDIVLSKYKTVIFINGCFWHGHKDCKKAKLPSTNTVFWENKISGTVQRDALKAERLESLGWFVIVCWECEVLHKAIAFSVRKNHLILKYKAKE